MTYQEQERQREVQLLMELETDFIDDMQSAIVQYGRPLRHSILTPALYSTLFQNVEKVRINSSRVRHR